MKKSHMIKMGRGTEISPVLPGQKNPLMEKGQVCKVVKGGKCRGGGGSACSIREISSNAKSGGQDEKGHVQKQGVIVILDDEPLLRKSSARAVKTGTAREVLTAGTVGEAMEHITNNPVSLIILDRKLQGGVWGDEVIARILKGDEPQKALCVVMYTSSPDKVKQEIKDIIGENRIFDKPNEMDQLIALVEHISSGGEINTWEKLKPEELPQPKPKSLPKLGSPPGKWKSKLKL